jgi:CRP/FNR family transcriptional regulator, cyclic AMP receptor protein
MNLQHKASVLARTELFQEVDEETRTRVAERAVARVFERGEFLFIQGAASDRLFVLARGAVKVYASSREGDIVELARHHAPAVIEPVDLVDDLPHSATAETLERSTLLVIPRSELQELVRSEGRVAEGLARTLGGDTRRTRQQVTELAFLDLQGRVARQLLKLSGGGSRTRRVTQAELATMVSGARQTVNQVLRSLESLGYISAAGRVFVILDRERLEGLAEH